MTETETLPEVREHGTVQPDDIQIVEERGLCRVYVVNGKGNPEYLCQFDAMTGPVLDAGKNKANACAFVAALVTGKGRVTVSNDVAEEIPKRTWVRPMAPAGNGVYVSGPLKLIRDVRHGPTRKDKKNKWVALYHNTEEAGRDQWDGIDEYDTLNQAKAGAERWYYFHVREKLRDAQVAGAKS